MSRENTSENLSRAHETTVAKLIHLTENQSAKLSTFGRAMAGMLPVRRMRFNSLQPKVMQMLPRVMYRKEDGTAESEVKVVPVVERSAADGATETVSRMEVSMPSDAGNGQVVDEVDGKDEKKNLPIYPDFLSSSDSDLSLSEINLSSRGHSVHVVFASVGILMVTRHQVLVARMTQQVANDNLGGKGKTSAVDSVLSGGTVNVFLERKKASLLDQTKSRSLDVEELASRTKDGKNPNTRSDVQKELLRKKLVAEDFDKKGCVDDMLLKPTEFSGDSQTDESQVGKIPDVGDHSTGYPLIVVSDQEVTRPQPLLRRHSLLKISYSEGSLSNSLSASEENVPIGIDLDELDFYDPQAPGGSALNKLRVRVANLALPAMGMPENRQKQLREQARSSRQHSQLRFKGMKTRILLL